MDNSTEELLLQKLEELVFDEDKIVTISIFCEKCGITISEAKLVLKKFISDQSINPGKISTTYLINGILNTGDYAIQIVDSSVLHDLEKKYSSITDKSVYSVQKNNSIDFNVIAIAEKSECLRTEPLKESIVGENCIERQLKVKELPPPPPQKIFEKSKANPFFKKVEPKSTSSNESFEKKPKLINGNDAKVQKKAGGISSFLNSSSNVKINKENDAEVSPHNLISKKAKIENNGNSDTCEEVREIKNSELKIITGSENESPKHEKHSNKVSDKKVRQKKVSKEKKTEDAKKRKRIIMESDSDDDLFGKDEDDEMEVGICDEEKPDIPQPKTDLPPIPRNKRRKAVDKTYEDEDGYIVTRTEYVLVSASEDEEVEITEKKNKPKTNSKPEPQKNEKKSPPEVGNKGKKGKALASNQPTLMNFFKKK